MSNPLSSRPPLPEGRQPAVTKRKLPSKKSDTRMDTLPLAKGKSAKREPLFLPDSESEDERKHSSHFSGHENDSA